LPQLKDKTKEKEKPTSNVDLVPALPSSPLYSRKKSPEPPSPPVSIPKEKRGSLIRMFSKKSRPYEQSEEEPTLKKLPLFRKSPGIIIRRKFVFVGDGACGKTCFLMQVNTYFNHET
jgi:hypothetical protein